MNLHERFDLLSQRLSWVSSGVLTLGVASAAAVGVAYVMPGGSAAAAPEIIVESASPAVPVWTIADDLSGSSCTARRGPRLTGTAHALDLGTGCAVVSERLTEAVVWNERRDGTVALADASGRLVIAFAPTEGPGMEAYEPAHMMLSLSRQ